MYLVQRRGCSSAVLPYGVCARVTVEPHGDAAPLLFAHPAVRGQRQARMRLRHMMNEQQAWPLGRSYGAAAPPSEALDVDTFEQHDVLYPAAGAGQAQQQAQQSQAGWAADAAARR